MNENDVPHVDRHRCCGTPGHIDQLIDQSARVSPAMFVANRREDEDPDTCKANWWRAMHRIRDCQLFQLVLYGFQFDRKGWV